VHGRSLVRHGWVFCGGSGEQTRCPLVKWQYQEKCNDFFFDIIVCWVLFGCAFWLFGKENTYGPQDGITENRMSDIIFLSIIHSS